MPRGHTYVFSDFAFSTSVVAAFFPLYAVENMEIIKMKFNRIPPNKIKFPWLFFLSSVISCGLLLVFLGTTTADFFFILALLLLLVVFGNVNLSLFSANQFVDEVFPLVLFD